MLPENRSFMIRGEDGQEYGPVDLGELREWVQENRAGLGTEVRLDEPGSAWQPWQNFPELIALLAEVHVTSPVPGQPGLVIAPMGKRILACIMDLILSSILTSPIFYVWLTYTVPNWQNVFTQVLLQPQTPLPEPIFFYVMICNLVSYLALALYTAGFHAAHGKTPGKSLLRLRVVDQNGQKPSLAKSLIRGLVYALSLNYLYGLPLLYAFFNPQRRTVHDLLAGTYVVEA
jgi:uncharacterized RDD family membrane protein YckC